MMKKPKHKVQKLAIARDGAKFTATWTTPKDATAEKVKKNGKQVKNEHRFANVFASWVIRTVGNPVEIIRATSKGRWATSDVLNVNSFTPTIPRGTYTRASFYPNGPIVPYVSLWVHGTNSEGGGPSANAVYEFLVPRTPTVAWTYSEEAATVTVTVTSDAGTDRCERYDTMAYVDVKLGNGTKQVIRANSVTNTGTTWSATYQVASYAANFAIGQTLVFSCTAYSRGFRGDGGKASASFTVGAPNPATIQGVSCDSLGENGRIRVGVSVGARTQKVQLERRHGESGSWETVTGAVDDGACKALYDTIGMADLVNGEHLYYRVVSTNLNYTAVSAVYRADELFTEAISGGSVSVGFVGDLVPADNGQSAKAVIGWNVTSGQTISGIEVSWSDDPNAWNSTDPPNTFDATWKDATSQSQSWDNTLTIYILGLSQGTTYYVTARPYVDNDGERTYADYGPYKTVSPTTRPSSVTLECPDYVARGEDIPLSWTFDGDSEQTEWHVFMDEAALSTKLEGFDSMGYASVPAYWYEGKSAIDLYVRVGTGGEMTKSNVRTVGISDHPECHVLAPEAVTAKPSQFALASTSPDCIAVVRCVSQGIGDHGPLGGDAQYPGDSAWSANLLPEWLSVDAILEDSDPDPDLAAIAQDVHDGFGSGLFMAVLEIPVEADLVDGASYSLAANVVDRTTGLRSDAASTEFSVAWAHQAPNPSDSTYVSADSRSRTATVHMAAPTGAVSTDVCDVYRGTASGFELIASDLKVDDTFTDRYATFSDGSIGYRIAIRTADGDVAWGDYLYTMRADVTRFDWPGGSLEVGWALRFEDTWQKSFEAREHKDGSVGGAYNPAVSRSGTYTAEVIKELDEGALEALSELAEHPGSVYCRRPDGHAFQCNVDLSSTEQRRSMLMEPSFAFRRVSLTEEFMLSPDDVEGWEE